MRRPSCMHDPGGSVVRISSDEEIQSCSCSPCPLLWRDPDDKSSYALQETVSSSADGSTCQPPSCAGHTCPPAGDRSPVLRWKGRRPQTSCWKGKSHFCVQKWAAAPFRMSESRPAGVLSLLCQPTYKYLIAGLILWALWGPMSLLICVSALSLESYAPTHLHHHLPQSLPSMGVTPGASDARPMKRTALLSVADSELGEIRRGACWGHSVWTENSGDVDRRRSMHSVGSPFLDGQMRMKDRFRKGTSVDSRAHRRGGPTPAMLLLAGTDGSESSLNSPSLLSSIYSSATSRRSASLPSFPPSPPSAPPAHPLTSLASIPHLSVSSSNRPSASLPGLFFPARQCPPLDSIASCDRRRASQASVAFPVLAFFGGNAADNEDRASAECRQSGSFSRACSASTARLKSLFTWLGRHIFDSRASCGTSSGSQGNFPPESADIFLPGRGNVSSDVTLSPGPESLALHALQSVLGTAPLSECLLSGEQKKRRGEIKLGSGENQHAEVDDRVGGEECDAEEFPAFRRLSENARTSRSLFSFLKPQTVWSAPSFSSQVRRGTATGRAKASSSRLSLTPRDYAIINIPVEVALHPVVFQTLSSVADTLQRFERTLMLTATTAATALALGMAVPKLLQNRDGKWSVQTAAAVAVLLIPMLVAIRCTSPPVE